MKTTIRRRCNERDPREFVEAIIPPGWRDLGDVTGPRTGFGQRFYVPELDRYVVISHGPGPEFYADNHEAQAIFRAAQEPQP